MFSTSTQWTLALERDTCVTDAYAKTSREEGLAQAAIVKSYLAGRPSDSTVYRSKSIGELESSQSADYTDPFLGDYSCMKHQLMALECLDAFYTPSSEGAGCLQLDEQGSNVLRMETDSPPQYETWWEIHSCHTTTLYNNLYSDLFVL
ncbi:hypothetical protein M408DRAFT_26092 [Serendipita vermifera MAFF 305830]|uniref:Uncharacterized protein n=1 Tax=Serendipita vermifera MAFF 305830 TaxID=933852 RepID=A0A0C3ALT2_SERVB|nr:hypothetical protein M408DRAFT_26092 [Serendipita vermifera MAFF 305830]